MSVEIIQVKNEELNYGYDNRMEGNNKVSRCIETSTGRVRRRGKKSSVTFLVPSLGKLHSQVCN